MKKVFRIHGFGGQPNGGWGPWLMGELAQKDIWGFSPAMPTPSEPQKEEWVKEIVRSVGEPNEEVILVGHSLGVCAILHYLQTLPENKKIRGAVLVSGPIHVLPKDKYRPIDEFMNTPFDFDHLKKVCGKFTVIHGDNDQSVPFAHAEELAKNLSCNLVSIPNGGHLNGSSGWYKLPEVLAAVLEMVK